MKQSGGFAVAEDGPTVEEGGEGEEGEEGFGQVGAGAAFEVDQSENGYDVSQGADVAEHLGPSGHAGYRCVEAAHEDECDDKEKNHENPRLYCPCII